LGFCFGTRQAKATPEQNQCRYCHAPEVDGFARSKMARSMRVGGQEPKGVVKAPDTTITMYSDRRGSWQRLESQVGSPAFHVDYVVGSGTHASGYITSVANHVFQSPVAFYSSRSAYDLAPGFDKVSDPDFTRPIEVGCVFCHAGSFDAKAGTINEYADNPFPHLAISCDRCHGPTAAHLANPGRRTIVNPARLDAPARDSICELSRGEIIISAQLITIRYRCGNRRYPRVRSGGRGPSGGRTWPPAKAGARQRGWVDGSAGQNKRVRCFR
jgi:hypothetical protein